MVTKLGQVVSKAVARETRAAHRGRAIVVQLDAGGRMVRFKLKGTRTWYGATVEQLFWVAVGNRAAELRNEKAERRKARARERGRQ